MFAFLDRGEKGYASYQDFCQMAVEKRRGLDPIDDSHIPTDPVEKITRETWRKTYMDDCDIHDLEDMARHFSGFSKTVRTTVTQRIQPKDKNVPKFVARNPDHSYGVRSDLALQKAPTIARIVNNDYLKEFLTDRIASKAIEATTRRNIKKVTRDAKPFKFRSGSVMSRVPKAVVAAEKAILRKAQESARISVRTQQSDQVASS